jgi:hypothetical protein
MDISKTTTPKKKKKKEDKLAKKRSHLPLSQLKKCFAIRIYRN